MLYKRPNKDMTTRPSISTFKAQSVTCPGNELQEEEDGLIHLHLNNLKAVFTGSKWRAECVDESSETEVVRLRQQCESMTKEKNMAQLANEILLDMVTSKSLKIQKMEQEIEQLRALVRNYQLNLLTKTGSPWKTQKSNKKP